MSLSLDRMRYLVRKGLGGLTQTQLSDEDCDELLNMSLWAIEDTFPFRTKEKCFKPTASIGVGKIILAIDRLDAITSVSIVDDSGQSHKLGRMTRDWLDENSNEQESGIPSRYLRENNTLILYPIPDKAYELVIHARQSVASLAEGSVETTGLPRNWDEIVVQGAIWRGHYFNEDYDLARQAANFQIGLIRQAVTTEAKEERDSRYAALNVLHDWPDDYVP